ncbi:MAG: sortase [Bacilli bacterium]|nr:sortase [Bacilli bacterium]
MQNTHTKNKIIIVFGVTLFIIGLIFLSSNYLNEKRDIAYQYMNNLLLESVETVELKEEVGIMDTTSSLEETTNQEEQKSEETEEYVDPYLKYYIGTLEIPKINLSKGFTDINSKYNTVNKNIQVVETSTYPDVDKGNFIIAAHSGTSYLAYFKNLYKLQLGDMAFVNYKGKRYSYKIVDIYEQEKTGQIAIYRDVNKTTMTLVTCTKDSKTKQTIYILELVNIENI